MLYDNRVKIKLFAYVRPEALQDNGFIYKLLQHVVFCLLDLTPFQQFSSYICNFDGNLLILLVLFETQEATSLF